MELAWEFKPSAEAIRNWIKQADLDEGKRIDGLTTIERRFTLVRSQPGDAKLFVTAVVEGFRGEREMGRFR